MGCHSAVGVVYQASAIQEGANVISEDKADKNKNKKKLGMRESDNQNSRLEGYLHLLSADERMVRVDPPP